MKGIVVLITFVFVASCTNNKDVPLSGWNKNHYNIDPLKVFRSEFRKDSMGLNGYRRRHIFNDSLFNYLLRINGISIQGMKKEQILYLLGKPNSSMGPFENSTMFFYSCTADKFDNSKDTLLRIDFISDTVIWPWKLVPAH